jgi:molecular chaperone DnaK
MTYELGVDLGTTYTAAAVYRDGRAEIVELGTRTAAIPSVLFVREDDSLLIGEPATRRGVAEPGRLAREFKRRFGDPTPLILGGSPYSADTLMAKVLRWVVRYVAEREGGPPERVTVSHPANWGQFKRDLLEQAIRLAGLTDAKTITEPEAAAVYYASNERVESGSIVAVYDLGGGTFDAAVLRKTDQGFEIMGRPEGIEHLGGVDFDQAIMAEVDRATAGALGELDPADSVSSKAASRLREEIVEAKEALSSDTDASVPVVLPSVQTEVRITRAEFEDMIRASIGDTIAALRRALDSGGVSAAEVSKVLLVGGSSRIPLVAQMVSAELGRPVAVDAHPKHAIPLGAALAAAGVVGEPEGAVTEEVAAPLPPEPAATLPMTGPAEIPDQTPEREAAPVSRAPSRAPVILAAIVVLIALLAGGAWALGLPPFADDDADTSTEEQSEPDGPQEEPADEPADEPDAPEPEPGVEPTEEPVVEPTVGPTDLPSDIPTAESTP